MRVEGNGRGRHTQIKMQWLIIFNLMDLEWSKMCDSRQEPLKREDLPWMWGAPSHGLQAENECKCKNRGQMSINIHSSLSPDCRHKSPCLLCMSSWLLGNCLYHLKIKQNNLFLSWFALVRYGAIAIRKAISPLIHVQCSGKVSHIYLSFLWIKMRSLSMGK